MPNTIEYQSVPEITICATADDWNQLQPGRGVLGVPMPTY